MKTPPFLLGVTLLFWGWQTGFLFVGAVLGVLLEAARWSRTRWEFSDADFSRIWTFCSLLLLVAALYALTANEAASDMMSFLQNPTFRNQRDASTSGARSMAELIRWQPMIFAPFMLAAAYSAREGVPLHTISLILQRRWRKARRSGQNLAVPGPVVSVTYPYFGLCLFASSIEPTAPQLFFWPLCGMVAWALWPWRSQRFSVVSWGMALVAAIALGYAGQRAINQFQQYLGNLNPLWLARYSGMRFDPRHSRTMIGEVGRNKNSGSIVVRVQVPAGGRVPPLLREASYRDYRGQVWFATGGTRMDFIGVPPETNLTSYVLMPDKPVTNKVQIACYLPGGNALLPLPRGSTRLDRLNAYIVEKNDLGAVHVEGPGLVIFDSLYGPGRTFDIPPEDSADLLSVPERERPALEEIVRELNLQQPTLHQAMQAIQALFANKFTYRPWQERPVIEGPNTNTPLGRFLLKTRAGHCEYFATATVLLLRQMGFSARYAVGYAVHEASGSGRYVVRQRDAHAWCLVWNNAVWLDFDTTPGSWIDAEAQRASRFQALSDFWARISFEISRVRWGQSHLRQYLIGTSLPVLAILLIQILRTRRKRKGGAKTTPRAPVSWPGLDSEFYEVERALANRGVPRLPNEPISEWLIRACSGADLASRQDALRELLRLHYRYRFDPLGLSVEDRARLKRRATECLQA